MINYYRRSMRYIYYYYKLKELNFIFNLSVFIKNNNRFYFNIGVLYNENTIHITFL